VTIGGGVVLDISDYRYRKADNQAARLDVLASGDRSAQIALLVREAPFGLPLHDLQALTALREAEIVAASAKAPMVAITQPHSWYLDRNWFQSARDRLVQAVRAFHAAQPLVPGMAKQDLRSRERPDSPPFLIDALLAAAKELVVEGETVRLRSHKVVLKKEEEQAKEAIERAFASSGLAVPAVAEVLAKSGVEASPARRILEILLREKRLVRISQDLVFHHSAIEELRRLLAARKSTRFNVGAFKEWTGISRKYAIPLLEFLDREHVTRRDGDERVVL
jgi:selenocysteine-specific elongation factor